MRAVGTGQTPLWYFSDYPVISYFCLPKTQVKPHSLLKRRQTSKGDKKSSFTAKSGFAVKRVCCAMWRGQDKE